MEGGRQRSPYYEHEDVGVMDETVDDGPGDVLVAEELTPVDEVLVVVRITERYS